MPKPITRIDEADFNWLTANDEGKPVLVTGHWQGDFQGIVKYGGIELAIITDSNGDDIEVCYMRPIEFHRL